ncbi:MAG: gamma-glutamyl-gamma-aminobutyrate hydrolase family protein [Candidatus Woesearchaeota archaeon]
MMVAISQREITSDNRNFDSLEQEYIEYFNKRGVKLFPISNRANDLDSLFNSIEFHGIILSGGNNICPSRYNQNHTYPDCSPFRDNVESKLLEIALKKDIPLMGICRGMQFINVYFGGILIPDLNLIPAGHVAVDHKVYLSNSSKNYLCKDSAEVNSYHNQGLTDNELSSVLTPFAKCVDGVVEGIFHKEYPIAGIQWHPERKSPDEHINDSLVDAFLNRKLFWG